MNIVNFKDHNSPWDEDFEYANESYIDKSNDSELSIEGARVAVKSMHILTSLHQPCHPYHFNVDLIRL